MFVLDLTTIDPVVSEIICLIKIDTIDRQVVVQAKDRYREEKAKPTFYSLLRMEYQENMKVAIQRMESIII